MVGGRTAEGAKRLRLKATVDVAAWTLAAIVAFPLRTPSHWLELTPTIAEYVLLGIPVYLALELRLRLHRQSWRNVTLLDLERLVLAVALGSGVMFGSGSVSTDGRAPGSPEPCR